jgi:hypothetical protein
LPSQQQQQQQSSHPFFGNNNNYGGNRGGVMPGMTPHARHNDEEPSPDENNNDDNNNNNNPWWEQTIGKPSYPAFLVGLEKARRSMKERVVPTTTNSNIAGDPPSSWTLASPPPDQPVHFTKPILPPPTKIMSTNNNNNNNNNNNALSSSSSSILVMVLSAPENFIKRQAIRETWATDSVVFVLGQADCASSSSSTNNNDDDDDNDKKKNATTSLCPLQESLLREQATYHDILEIPIVDHYSTLPEKVVQMYQFVIGQEDDDDYLQHIQWLIKADDDMYVRPKTLEAYLRKYNSQIPMVIGKIVPHSSVAREGKWAEVGYDKSHYPYWPQGSAGHIVSRAAARYITQQSSSLHRYQGEDVSIGIWMDDSKLRDLTYIQAKRMMTNEGTANCGNSKYMMIGHDLSPEEVYDCHLKFEKLQPNGTSTIVDNTWLDDPAEWKKQIDSQSVWGGWSDILG